MLPTKGYFQDIECPYNNSSCGRPYCHFRHRKKGQDIADDNLIEENCVVPTYKPTPKSELANSRSHIPISYVPDLVFRSERTIRPVPKFSFQTKPTYKPTPISMLSSAATDDFQTQESEKTINKIKQNMVNIKYSPDADNIPDITYNPTSLKDEAIVHNMQEHEYKPTGENIADVKYNPTSLENIGDSNSSEGAYKPSGAIISNKQYNPTTVEESTIDFENLSNEFDMIDEIISNSNDKVFDKSENEEKNVISEANEVNNDKKEEILTIIPSQPQNHVEKKSTSSSKVKSSKSHMSSSKSNKVSSHEKRGSEKSSEKSHKSRTKEKHRKEDKKKEKEHHSTSRKHKTEERNKDKEKSKQKQSESKSRDSKQDHEKEKHTSKHKYSEKHKQKHKSEDKKHKEIKLREIEVKSENVSSDEFDNSVLKHKSQFKEVKKYKNMKVKKENNASDDFDNLVVKHKLEDEVKKHKKVKEKEVKVESEKMSSDEFDMFDDDAVESLPDIDDMDFEDETMKECYKIFNEYKPPESTEKIENESEQETKFSKKQNEEMLNKKRVAHSNASHVEPKIKHIAPIMAPSAAQVMTNRFKLAKTLQASNEQNNIINEIRLISKRPAPRQTHTLLEAAKKHKLHKNVTISKPSTSIVDDIINGVKVKPLKIAPVRNVMNIQRAKAQLEELSKKRAIESINRTPAQITKGAKRQAHVPDYSLEDIPDVLEAAKSKLPVNVRTRFLTLLADECVKLYLMKADAYSRALNEEFSCYQRCKVLTTYRNCAMLAVNRLRKECTERQQKGLDLLSSNEPTKQNSSELKGSKLYNIIQQYVLTEEELDIHGYPRESRIPGKAVIKNSKPQSINLPQNQRKCSRCSKIYLVDDDGIVIYEEDCLYHPLKKRTIKREQFYLCCKTNDDTGCVTSNTHVCEMSEEAALEGYQTTMEPEHDDDPRSMEVYALDCEMCYTTRGLELTRITIIDAECKTVYESLVKPLNPIIDYNTRFSGITQQHMDKTRTGILQVQANILHLCNSKTILIGHSLESDMKALKIVHGSIIDTAVLFPHKMGLPHKRALRVLASEHLRKIIQNDISGHDSAEDAITCMELILWKVKEESKVKSSKL